MTEQVAQAQAGANPQPGSPEYIAEMVRRGENPQQFQQEHLTGVKPEPAPKADVPPLPEGGFDKFYNKETGAYDWKAHAVELQFKLEQSAKKGGEQQKPQQKADGQQEGDDTAKQVVEAAGLDWNDIQTKVAKDFKLDDADYEKLEKIGIPREIVDGYIETAKYAQRAVLSEVHSYSGGKEKLDAALKWASQNLKPEEIDQINGVLATPNWKLGIDALMSRFTQNARGAAEPKLFSGVNVAPGTNAGFANQSEMMEAMAKRNSLGQKLYDIDPVYRQQVQQRMLASRFL
jgi:hypothetical protein